MRFGFVVHPLTSFHRRLLGVRSLDFNLAITEASNRPGARRVSTLGVTDPSGKTCEGILVATTELPEELLGDQEAAVAAVTAAVGLCQEAGAEIVGLGAVAAIVGGQGKAVARAAPCAVSTGNAFTAYAAIETVELARRRGRRSKPIGLLGPPGPVANGILRGLMARGIPVDVVASVPPKPLQRLVAKLNAQTHGVAQFVEEVGAVTGPDRILVTASSTGARIRLSSLAPESVVIDVAAPVDVIIDDTRDDVLLLDGEYVRLPSPLRGGLWRRIYGLVTGQSRHIFACFAEPMLLALAGDTEHLSVGREVPLERIRALGLLASEHGFYVDRLHEKGRTISAARFRRFFGDG